jgi:predicted MPP superfamily phosphohydrolase
VLGLGRKYASVSTIELPIRDLPPAFDGYTIVVLADLHQPPDAPVDWLRHAVRVTNALNPDLIALLGDYGYSFESLPGYSRRWYSSALGAMADSLRQLRAKDGVIALLGNHDYDAGATLVVEWLRDVGADVLVNRSRCVSRNGNSVRVFGLDDLKSGMPQVPVDFDSTDRVPTLVLSHNPDGVFLFGHHPRVDVVIAGHTHGGQIVLPWYGAPTTMARVCTRRVASGWVPNEIAPLYVTRGLGEQLPLPLRVNCPPEILVVRLRSGQQPE